MDALFPDVDASALSPHAASNLKRVFKAKSPPDKDEGSDAAGRHPASPLKASAVNAIIRGIGVREEGQMLLWGIGEGGMIWGWWGMGVSGFMGPSVAFLASCVYVCVTCVCVECVGTTLGTARG